MFCHETFRSADDVRVKSPAPAPLSEVTTKSSTFSGSPAHQQGMGVRICPQGQARKNFEHFQGIGPRCQDRFLGPSQSRCSHHFHSIGDLLRVLNGLYPSSDVPEICHLSNYPPPDSRLLSNEFAFEVIQGALQSPFQILVDFLPVPKVLDQIRVAVI